MAEKKTTKAAPVKAEAKAKPIARPVKPGSKPIKAKKPVAEVFDAYKIVKFPLSTEKGIRLMESDNKLLFVVDSGADKRDIKKAIEILYNSKVVAVNTFNMYGQKRAYVTFDKSTPAINVATNLGLI